MLAYTFIYTVHNIAGYFTEGTIDPILSSRIDVVNEVCFPSSGISIPFDIIASAIIGRRFRRTTKSIVARILCSAGSVDANLCRREISCCRRTKSKRGFFRKLAGLPLGNRDNKVSSKICIPFGDSVRNVCETARGNIGGGVIHYFIDYDFACIWMVVDNTEKFVSGNICCFRHNCDFWSRNVVRRG